MTQDPTLIIAEIGVNHNGQMGLAKKLVKLAKDAGADIVKFQSFDASALVLPEAKTADYQRNNTKQNSQFELLKALEFSMDDQKVLHDYCEGLGIEYLSTAFDEKSLKDLLQLGVKRIKIPSGEITNTPLLELMASQNLPILISTGMCTLVEVEQALNILFNAGAQRADINIMHCTSNYPAEDAELNLRALNILKRQFNMSIGYSDHSTGKEAALGAIALGATVIEKHITLDKSMEGPDHLASMEMDEFKDYVTSIRRLTIALGREEKFPSETELKTKTQVRKSIVSLTAIKKGELFTEENLTTKRPETGISAINWRQLIGKRASRSYPENQQIDKSEL